MKKNIISLMSILTSTIVLVSGCTYQTNAHPTPKQTVKLIIGEIHHANSEFQPIEYNKQLGLLGTSPGILPSQVPNGYPPLAQKTDNYEPGRVVVLRSHTYLPQLDPKFGYAPSYVYSSTNWVCWIYLSMGIGKDYGERFYAYNISAKKEFRVWAPPKGSNEQIMEVHLRGNELYLGLQSSLGNTVKTKVVEVNLRTRRQKVLFSANGQGTQRVIEDFSVMSDSIAITYTPASHFVSSGPIANNEPYSIILYDLKGEEIRSIHSGYNINSFDFTSCDNGLVWSSKNAGVEYYNVSTRKVMTISKDPSYVETSGPLILWRGINDSKMGLFSTKTDKAVPFPSKEENSMPRLLGKMIVFRYSNSTKYDWAYLN